MTAIAIVVVATFGSTWTVAARDFQGRAAAVTSFSWALAIAAAADHTRRRRCIRRRKGVLEELHLVQRIVKLCTVVVVV